MIQKQHLPIISSLLLVLLLAACGNQEETSPVRKTIRQAVFASGQIIQDDEYLVSANADGIISELPISEGDSVEIGDLLAYIQSDVSSAQLTEAKAVYEDARKNALASSPQLQQIQLQISKAQTQLNIDQENYNRYKDLRAKNSVSALELEKAELQYISSKNNVGVLQKNLKEAQNALRLNEQRSRSQLNAQQAVISEYRITSDKPGLVTKVAKKKGELARKGEVIAVIGSGPFILKLLISEDDITKINIGQQASIHLNTHPDKEFTATVTKILPAFDESQQSYIIHATLDNPPALLLSGTQLQANIIAGERRDVLVIPIEALIRDHFVKLKNGNETEVTTGEKMGEWIEITSGLSETDAILIPKKKK